MQMCTEALIEEFCSGSMVIRGIIVQKEGEPGNEARYIQSCTVCRCVLRL